MKAALIYRQHTRAEEPWITRMASGLRRHGVEVELTDPRRLPRRCDFLACWGWRTASRYVETMPVLVVERGYVGDRFTWTSLGWNGLNGRARFPEVDDGGERFREHFGHVMQPWSRGGGYVLICGQVQNDAAVRNIDIRRWCRETARTLKASESLPVVFRPHPVEVERRLAPVFDEVETLTGSLEEALAGAALVVTWNSNAGVDAALAGVPVVACDPGSMAWAVAAHDVAASPVQPDREAWASRLAWCQWLACEIEDGSAWDRVRMAL